MWIYTTTSPSTERSNGSDGDDDAADGKRHYTANGLFGYRNKPLCRRSRHAAAHKYYCLGFWKFLFGFAAYRMVTAYSDWLKAHGEPQWRVRRNATVATLGDWSVLGMNIAANSAEHYCHAVHTDTNKYSAHTKKHDILYTNWLRTSKCSLVHFE